MQIDFERWRLTLSELRDARFSLRASNLQLNEAQAEFLNAQSVRDRAAAERALQHGNTAIAEAGERALAAAEQRLNSAQAELARVQARCSQISERFARQTNIVQTCVKWASAHNVVLPDGDAAPASALPPTTPTRGVDFSPFAIAMQMEGTAAPSSAEPAALSEPAGQPPGLLDRIKSALAGSPA